MAFGRTMLAGRREAGSPKDAADGGDADDDALAFDQKLGKVGIVTALIRLRGIERHDVPFQRIRKGVWRTTSAISMNNPLFSFLADAFFDA